ncbi:MAG: DNA-processing protein DprA [Melioribacteraceae bacterium]|nr:MAG: DNA-processing protein DprA [Melioribacteraceae bacterium]
MDLKNLSALSLLLKIDGLGPSKILNLVSKFHSPSEIFAACKNELSQVSLISSTLARRIQLASNELLDHVKIFQQEIEQLNERGFKLITYFDSEYPAILKNIYSPPIFLFVWGKLMDDDKYSLAVVGTRRPTAYGRKIAEKISVELVENRITIVSGLARGIDSIAHKTALKNGGRTVAILGSGLDKIYPPENKDLAKEISENGAVISEFPLGTKPDAQNFPRRNRIISGLTLGSVIVETNINGGAMQTARLALDQNREVFAVPGNLESPQSEGTNELIKESRAKLITSAEDILVELDLKLKPILGKNIPKEKLDISLFEQNILDHLDNNPIHIDQLSQKLGCSTSDCLVNLLTLEFKGLVKQLPGKQFISM